MVHDANASSPCYGLQLTLNITIPGVPGAFFPSISSDEMTPEQDLYWPHSSVAVEWMVPYPGRR